MKISAILPYAAKIVKYYGKWTLFPAFSHSKQDFCSLQYHQNPKDLGHPNRLYSTLVQSVRRSVTFVGPFIIVQLSVRSGPFVEGRIVHLLDSRRQRGCRQLENPVPI